MKRTTLFRTPLAFALIGAAVLAASAIWCWAILGDPASPASQELGKRIGSAQTMVPVIRNALTGSFPFESDAEAAAATLRTTSRIDTGPLSVDVYGDKQGAALAWGSAYSPRPVFQMHGVRHGRDSDERSVKIKKQRQPLFLADTLRDAVPLSEEVRSFEGSRGHCDCGASVRSAVSMRISVRSLSKFAAHL